MKFGQLIITSAILISAIPALASSSLKPGHYVGTGQWHSADGKAGQYQVETTIGNSPNTPSVQSTYDYDGQRQVWDFTMLFKSPGFFAIASGGGGEGNVNGSGYCLDVQCHYEVPGSNLEETFSFVDGKLYKIGSKTQHGKTLVWQESLTLTP